MADGTRYVYNQAIASQEIAETCVRNELSKAANAYQTYTRRVWGLIAENTADIKIRQQHQETHLARVNDALAFLAEANVARNHHLAMFQGNVEKWAFDHEQKVAALHAQVQEQQMEIQRVALKIPLPPAPSSHDLSMRTRTNTPVPTPAPAPLPPTPSLDIQHPQPRRVIRPPAVPTTPIQLPPNFPPRTGATPPLPGQLGPPPPPPPTLPPNRPPPPPSPAGSGNHSPQGVTNSAAGVTEHHSHVHHHGLSAQEVNQILERVLGSGATQTRVAQVNTS